MAAVVVALNNVNRLDDADSNTNWSNLDGGGPAAAAEAQLKYQGAAAVNRKVTSTSGREGVQFEGGTPRDISGGGLLIWKGNVADFGDLSTVWGVELRVGSAAAAYQDYNVAGSGANGPPFDSGYPARGGYLILAVDPEVTAWREGVTGSPDWTAVDYAAIAAEFVVGGAKSENVALDAIDLVAAGGGLILTRGDAGSTEGMFKDLADWDEGIVSNRNGLAVDADSVVVLRAMTTVGESGTATEFIDNDAIVVFPDGYHSAGSFGLTFNLENAGTIVEMGATIIGIGTITTEDTRPDFIVTGTTVTVPMILSGTLKNHRNVTLTSKVDADGAIIECQLLTQTSAEIQNTIIRTRSLTSVACLQDPTLGVSTGLHDTAFIQGGAGHALEIDTADDYTFTGLTFTGYGADASDAAAIDVTASAGIVNIYYEGAVPTYKTAGATVNMIASADYTINNIKDPTEITILGRDVSLLDITGTASDQNIGDVVASGKVGQSFQVATVGKAERIRLNLRKVGTPTDGLRIRLVNGVPGSSELLVSTFIPASELTTSYVEFDVDLDGKASLATATTYGIEIERSGVLDGSNYYQVEYDTSDVHASGTRYRYRAILDSFDSGELLRQTKNYSGSGDWLDEFGNSHDAQLGSTGGADTNDPQFLPWDGEDYVRLRLWGSGNFISTPDENLLDCDSSWFAQGAGGLWTVGTPSTDQATGRSPRSLKITGGASTAITPVTDAAMFGLKIYSVAGDDFDINGSTPVTVPAGVWTEITETGPDGTYTVNAAGAGDYYIAEVMLGTTSTFVASLRIVGNLDVRAMISRVWSDTMMAIASRRGTDTANEFAFQLQCREAGGTERLYFHHQFGGGTTQFMALGTFSIGDEEEFEAKATVNVSTGVVLVYKDGVVGTMHDNTGYVGALDVVTYPLEIGRERAGSYFAGDVKWVEERDGFDGPVVARYDAADAEEPYATQVGSVDGRTWTYNRSGFGLYVVERPSFGRHTDDYTETAHHPDLDFAGGDDFTMFVMIDATNATPSVDQVLLAKKADLATAAGYAIYLDTTGVPTGIIADGSASIEAVGGALSTRTRHVIAFKRDTAADTITVYTDGVAGTPVIDTTIASLANAEVLRTGRLSGAGTSYADGREFADVLFREALIDSEIVEVGNALLGVWESVAGDLLFSVMEAASDNELYHVESVTTGTTTWTHDGTVRSIEVLAMSLAFKALMYLDDVGGIDKSQAISQIPDLVYSNP